jgi:dienelactone hydrolase
MRVVLTLFLMALLLNACVSSNPEQRRLQSSKLATDAGWQRLTLNAGIFSMAAFLPANHKQTDTLTVYIEGDGLAWISSSTPSFDPTPINPLALRLALLDNSGSAVYLARPCQYVSGDDRHGCEQKYWTEQRFAPEVIAASNIAVSQLKALYAANNVRLIGYSGGGAVAALLAAKRNDVVQLVTVAGNLDHAAWTKHYRISPLSGSLNPADAINQLENIPQRHYIGGQDMVIGSFNTQSYVDRFPANKKPAISVIPTFNHHCCWTLIWPDVVKNGFGAINESEVQAQMMKAQIKRPSHE